MKSKDIALLLTLALLVSANANSQPASSEKTSTSKSTVSITSLNGKITQKATGLTVLTAGVRPVVIKVSVNAKTTFFLNGVTTIFSGIKVGDSVVVKYLSLSDQAIDAISVEAHRHRSGRVNDILDTASAETNVYPYCPHVGSGGSIDGKNIPCYCKQCGDAGSGMVW